MPKTFSQRAPAKINLALHVVGQRDDGLHELQSLVVFADICDELRATADEKTSLRLGGPFADKLSNDSENLVTKAIALFQQRWPDAVPSGVAVELTKNLPVASGIGGGSADAAAALRIMTSLSTTEIDTAELAELGLRLGADVPVCLSSEPCWMLGIGQKVIPLEHFPACHMVLVNPLLPIATADSFRLLENKSNPSLPDFSEAGSDLVALASWLGETRNDLQPGAILTHPVIAKIIDRLAKTKGCNFARMSGSGATVFGLFASAQLAEGAVKALKAVWPEFWTVSAPVILPD